MNPPIQGRIRSGIAHKPNVFLATFPTPQKFGQGDGGGRDHKMSGAPGPLVGAVLHRSWVRRLPACASLPAQVGRCLKLSRQNLQHRTKGRRRAPFALNRKPQPDRTLTRAKSLSAVVRRYSGRMLSGSQLERKCSESLGLTWPERKAFVPAKARFWHTAAPVVSQSSAGAAK
jgi:hypothetical protein